MKTFRGQVAQELCAQEGIDDPVLACRKFVRTVLDACDIQSWPVDLHMVADYLDVFVCLDPELRSPGYLVNFNGNMRVVINGSDLVVKQRFTLGHELTHAILPGDNHSYRRDANRKAFAPPLTVDDEEEYLCDIGAAEMLFPDHLLDRWVENRGRRLGVTSIEELSRDFQASLQASAVAITRASDVPFQVVGWGKIKGDVICPHQISASSSLPDEKKLPWSYRLEQGRQLFLYAETGRGLERLDTFSITLNGRRVVFNSEHIRMPHHPTLSMISVLRPQPQARRFPWEAENPIGWASDN